MIGRRKTKPTRAEKRKFSFGKWIYRFFVLIFFGSVIYVIFFSGLLAISRIDVSGNQTISSEDISSLVRDCISGKYLRVIEKNNFLWISPAKVSARIQEKFPKVERVSVERKFPNRILINVTERIAEMTFCSNGACFIIDENGQAYAAADSSSILENNITLTDLSDKDVHLHDGVFDSGYVAYISSLNKSLSADSGIEMTGNMETPSVVSSDIRVLTADGWKIYFNKDIDLGKELEMLRAVIEKQITKERLPDLEYIDLRSDNKVYYKMKNAERIEPQNPEASSAPAEAENKSKTEDKKKKK